MTDDAVYKKLCEVIDVENYISYYALQIFIGNEDWPHNNYKVYRYYAAEGRITDRLLLMENGDIYFTILIIVFPYMEQVLG